MMNRFFLANCYVGLFIMIGVGVTGYLLNITKFFHLFGDPVSTAFVVRLIGIVIPPLGIVFGWF